MKKLVYLITFFVLCTQLCTYSTEESAFISNKNIKRAQSGMSTTTDIALLSAFTFITTHALSAIIVKSDDSDNALTALSTGTTLGALFLLKQYYAIMYALKEK